RIFEGIVRKFRSEGAGGLVTLKENFRSRPEILQFANRLFAQAWQDAALPYEPLVRGAKHDPRESPSIEVLYTREPQLGTYPAIEAAALAERIKTMVESRELTITDHGHSECGQPVTYKHIAILLKALTDIEAYERAFAKAGVPLFVVGGG